jgi:hypothetical protein
MKLTNTAIATAVMLGVGGAYATSETVPASYDMPVSIDINFVLHIDEDLAEQDVFIERVPGSGEVYRATKGDRDLNQPLYAAASTHEHAPFDPDAVGPYPRGRPLGLTLGEWFAARGHGKYTCKDGAGRIDIGFENLVPNGVYTMWQAFTAWPPTEPFNGTYDLPMGARDGSESVFEADADGHASYQREFKPCLQLSGEQISTIVAIAWHSDGETYGHEPGEFATKTHVHLYSGLPKRSGI